MASLYEPASRRVLSRESALALAKRLMDLVGAFNVGVSIEHTSTALTRLANGSMLNTDDGEELSVTFNSSCGSGIPITIKTNQVNDQFLALLIDRVKALIPPPAPPAKDAITDEDPQDEIRNTLGPRTTLPVSLWHDSSVAAMEYARAEAIPKLVQQLGASNLRCAATVGIVARSVLHYYKYGLVAYGEETDCEVTVTARTPDGTGSGWGGVAHRDWARCSTTDAAARAIEIANKSRNPVALEPGRRTAILGPAAVAQLMYQMAELFDGGATTINWGMVNPRAGTPFTYRKNDGSGRMNHLGLRVMDERLMMVSDPADPDGGFAPFFNGGGKSGLPLGFPHPAMTWIDRGVLKNLAWGNDGIDRRVRIGDWPFAMRLSAAPGVKTATVEEMIAGCEEGIYVNRFSGVSLLRGERGTGMMTGVTRDGCFLIKNGKIDRPVKNFQFLESPTFAFNQIQMIGTPVRVPYGINAPLSPTQEDLWVRYRWGQPPRWPRPPMIVPSLMVRDFNFSALSDAV